MFLMPPEMSTRSQKYPKGHLWHNRIPGVCRAARELGVHPDHLSSVLHGRRVSHSLSRRFAEWQAAQTAAPSPQEAAS